MRTPLEYGDNFPVPFGSWDPGVPWRFPHQKVHLKRPGLLGQIFPWFMLVAGIAVGVVWMSWHVEEGISGKGDDAVQLRRPQGAVLGPSSLNRGSSPNSLKTNQRPLVKIKSRLA